MRAYLLILALLPGDGDSDAQAALALAAAARMPRQAPILTYADAYAESLKTGKPLIVWVGRPNRDVAGCVCCSVQSLDGYNPPCCVVSEPMGQQGVYWKATLPAVPTDEEIHDVLHKQPDSASEEAETAPENKLSPIARFDESFGDKGSMAAKSAGISPKGIISPWVETSSVAPARFSRLRSC